MKKFQFPLDTVKNFKDQELEELRREHAIALARVQAQEAVVQGIRAELKAERAEFDTKKQQGIRVLEAQSFDLHIHKLNKTLEHERKQLHLLRMEEQERLGKVVEKKQEISSIEKLREKRVDEYNKAVQKEEEAFIEEIVLNKRAAAST